MAIRESLLNTITTVANSDFVRLVTSAGESSKATVANLFKSFESGLGAKSSLTTSDYIRVVGSDNVSYKQGVDSLMRTIGIKYEDLGSVSTQASLETALETKLNAMPTNSTASLRIATSASFGVFQSGVTYICELRKGGSATYASISLHGLGINAEIVGNKASSTWTFQNEPTREEVDALNSKTGLYTLAKGAGNSTTMTLTLSATTSGYSVFFAGRIGPNSPTGAVYGVIVLGSNNDVYIQHSSSLTIGVSRSGSVITLTLPAAYSFFNFMSYCAMS